ncbi:MAG: hypothetical protein LBQ54_11585 [Planctomycetaceae bacterium]|nr:hypothetical protein [Planctomycetaceae bacterium]
MPKTLRGKEVFPEEIEEGDEGLKLILNRTQGTHIQPKQEISTFPDELMLSQYFDLSLPGTYKLTCYRTTFLKGFQWEPPFQSNTIEFTIKKSNLSSSPMAKPVTDPITDQTSASLSTEQDPRLALFPVLEEYYNRFKHNYGYTNFYSDQLRYPGDFDNPPHGKEVFEQKEIPERVRY